MRSRDAAPAERARREDGDRRARAPGGRRRRDGRRTDERRRDGRAVAPTGFRSPAAGASSRGPVMRCPDVRTVPGVRAARALQPAAVVERRSAGRTAARAAAPGRRHQERRARFRPVSSGSRTSSGNPLVKRPGADRVAASSARRAAIRPVLSIDPGCVLRQSTQGPRPGPDDVHRAASKTRVRHSASLVWWGRTEYGTMQALNTCAQRGARFFTDPYVGGLVPSNENSMEPEGTPAASYSA